MGPRLLLTEPQILKLRWLTDIGVPLKTALINEGIEGSASRYKLILQHHVAMEAALAADSMELYQTIFDSLFPVWAGSNRPSTVDYVGTFPIGHWVEAAV